MNLHSGLRWFFKPSPRLGAFAIGVLVGEWLGPEGIRSLL